MEGWALPLDVTASALEILELLSLNPHIRIHDHQDGAAKARKLVRMKQNMMLRTDV